MKAGRDKARWIRCGAALWLGLLAAGCVSDPFGPLSAPEREVFDPVLLPAARIVKVDNRHGYFVMRCVAKPAKDREVAVFHGERRTALARIRRVRGHLATADIIEGEARTGDVVYFPRYREP